MRKKPLVSIIVPIYGVEQYIEKCVESILSQTYTNIEVVLVDDESPDKSPAICDQYASRDGRVKVLHKKNGGLSDARNAGLEVSTGEYISFIDGDDYVAKNFIETLINLCIDESAEISCCGYIPVFEDYGKGVNSYDSTLKKTFTAPLAIEDTLKADGTLQVMTWNKLYSRNVFEADSIRFPVGKIHEDNFTTYRLLFNAIKIAYSYSQLYFYIQRPDSIMGKPFNIRSLDRLEALTGMESFLNEKLPYLLPMLLLYRHDSILGLVSGVVRAEIIDIELLKKLQDELKSNYKKIRQKNINIGHRRLILTYMILFSPTMYGYLRKIFKTRSNMS